MKPVLIDTWFDAITERWRLTVWLLEGEDFEPETDRLLTLETAHVERAAALAYARELAEALRNGERKVALLPVRPRWLEDSEETVAGAIDGRLAVMEDFDRQMAEALLGVVSTVHRLRVVTALEGRL